jgi:hypothetical protein
MLIKNYGAAGTAMAAGGTNKPTTIEEIVALTDADMQAEDRSAN